MLCLQYSSTNDITKIVFYSLWHVLQDYESHSVSVLFLPALLMASEACSLAPCIYPLLVYCRSSLNLNLTFICTTCYIEKPIP